MDRLSNVTWSHPKPSENPKISSRIFADPWSKSAHARSFRSRFDGTAELACLHHGLIEVIKISRSCLLEVIFFSSLVLKVI